MFRPKRAHKSFSTDSIQNLIELEQAVPSETESDLSFEEYHQYLYQREMEANLEKGVKRERDARSADWSAAATSMPKETGARPKSFAYDYGRSDYVAPGYDMAGRSDDFKSDPRLDSIMAIQNELAAARMNADVALNSIMTARNSLATARMSPVMAGRSDNNARGYGMNEGTSARNSGVASAHRMEEGTTFVSGMSGEFNRAILNKPNLEVGPAGPSKVQAKKASFCNTVDEILPDPAPGVEELKHIAELAHTKPPLVSDTGIPYTEEEEKRLTAASKLYCGSVERLHAAGRNWNDVRPDGIFRESPQSKRFYSYRLVPEHRRMVRYRVDVDKIVRDYKAKQAQAAQQPNGQSDEQRGKRDLAWVWNCRYDIFWAVLTFLIVVAGITTFFFKSAGKHH